MKDEYMFTHWWIYVHKLMNICLWNDEYMVMNWWIYVYELMNNAYEMMYICLWIDEYIFMNWWMNDWKEGINMSGYDLRLPYLNTKYVQHIYTHYSPQ